MAFLVSYFAVLFLLNFMWEISFRAIWVWVLVLLGMLLLSHPTHWSDQSAFHFIGVVILVVLAAIPFLVFGIRLTIASLRDEVGHSRVIWVDHVLAGVSGGLIAATTFRSLALIGFLSDRAVFLHVELAVIAVALCGAAYFVVSLWRALLMGIGFGLLSLTIWSGFWYPPNVLDRAASFAGAAEYDLKGFRRGWLEHRSELTFLTMPKGRRAPHVVLSYETETGTCNASWSYFASDFRTDNNMVDSRHCPRRSR